MSAQGQLLGWFHERGFRAKHLRMEYTQPDGATRVVFSTTKNNYFVSYKDTYLGLTVSSRLTRPGENWLRGNDLHDGPFTRETFDGMMDNVLRYELREVSDVAPPPPWTLEGAQEQAGVPMEATTEESGTAKNEEA